MGRTIVVQFITLDGVVEDPDGRGGTPFGGWAMRYGPAGIDGDKFDLGEVMTDGVLLFGRTTWEHFATLWPARDNAFAKLMNDATKAVATHRPIDRDAWSNSSAIEGDLEDWVRATTRERDVAVIGSQSVVTALAAADLVDEYRLLTFPIALGAGRVLFPAGVEVRLVSTEARGPGMLSVYAAR
ncbi:dihydrofolate reductase family protein [Protaetiibacter mangrovi]|uniref:Dihydrofolate reductase family protein n=1 Tax=Protaetiibacter mangrovi TaxID=2970926 RepID=A0ABT1ZEI7_9MICO|nr:dihydrofolate reductase family protein [Protaetiibacter mangrovi]MCS0499118.1 dihydrofolate reductase family protein [Protaetiibacter mangrovi]TPX02818.1 riboflavin biosynthesis protein RibD [Schumannella luteola]